MTSPTDPTRKADIADLRALVKRLREPFVACPFDKRSPDFRKDYTGKPCPVCGGTEDGPDKCLGGDTRIVAEAATAIESLTGRAEAAEAGLATAKADERTRIKSALAGTGRNDAARFVANMKEKDL